MTKPKDTTQIKKTFYQKIATAIAKARDGGVTVPEILEAFKEHVGMIPNENSDGTVTYRPITEQRKARTLPGPEKLA
jgi:beta-galactosidase GanA